MLSRVIENISIDSAHPIADRVHEIRSIFQQSTLQALMDLLDVEPRQSASAQAESTITPVISIPVFRELQQFNDGKIVLLGEGFEQRSESDWLGGHNGGRLLFTSPHTLRLCRDGFKVHLNEVHTGDVARQFASINRGFCLTWSKSEVARVRDLGNADPSNRDPNFLSSSEVRGSPWLEAIAVVGAYFGASDSPKLHVDVHGMKDAELPDAQSDCCVGTAAMFRQSNFNEVQQEEFIRKVTSIFAPVLQPRGYHLHFNAIPSGKNLSGDWSKFEATKDKHSLTQISTNKRNFDPASSCFSTAIQLELSLRLRKHLVQDDEFRAEFALCFPKIIE
jgi:hypothetical protein